MSTLPGGNTTGLAASHQYDGSGNTTRRLSTLAYDAENRLVVSSTPRGSATVDATYADDADGRRVQKAVAGGATATYAYDALGRLAAEYSSVASPANPPCATCYVTADALGSTRLVTDQTGAATTRFDWLPFGGEVPADRNGRAGVSGYGAASSLTQRFTGKERDAETGLDYFGARYMSSAQGRFMSPDAPFVDQRAADPQSWNTYAYVRNKPLKYRDPNGQICIRGFGNTCNETTPASTATQGAATGTGAQMLNDGVRRGQYQQAASGLSGPGASAGRKALQAETYAKLSPIGKGMTDAAKAARVGQLAGKTAEQLGQSASRTSGTWNAIGGASKIAGAAGVVVGVGMAATDIASAPEGQRGQVVAGQVGALGGGLAGGYGGAWLEGPSVRSLDPAQERPSGHSSEVLSGAGVVR